jgi:hypothetical protein
MPHRHSHWYVKLMLPVVIHEGRVVDTGQDDLALALRFFSEHGNVPIHVGLVTDAPEPVTRIPHYREQLPSGGSR